LIGADRVALALDEAARDITRDSTGGAYILMDRDDAIREAVGLLSRVEYFATMGALV
jgi:hypothetical protein